MPRIQIRPVQVEPNLHLAQAVQNIGEIFGKAILARSKAKAKADRDAERIEERKAGREAVVRSIERLGAEQTKQANRQAVREALASPGGALGPFGALNPAKLAEGVEKSLKVQQRIAQAGALARKMSPSDGRQYLEQIADEERKAAVAGGYHEELVGLQDAMASGKIAPDVGKKLGEALQSALREGRSTTDIHKLIVKSVDLFEKTKQRLVGWKEADSKAAAMLKGMEQVASATTDDEVRADLMKKIALGRAEWARTEDGPGGNPFRMKNDAQASLGALQKIVFESEALAGLDEPGSTQAEAARAAGVRTLMTSPAARAAKFGPDSKRAAAPSPSETYAERSGIPTAKNKSVASEPDVQPGPGQPMRDFMQVKRPVAKGFVTELQRTVAQGGSRDEVREALRSVAERWSINLETLDERTVASLIGAPTAPKKTKIQTAEERRIAGLAKAGLPGRSTGQ